MLRTASDDTITDENYRFSWGRHKGRTIREVLDSNPSYIVWLQKNTTMDFHHEILHQAETLPEKP